jgi:hypothetical protein
MKNNAINSSNIFLSFFLSLLAFFPLNALAHGENTTGPHGGIIRMPGAFHTEVLHKKNGYQVYFLDINMVNPTVLKTTLEAFLTLEQKKIPLSCQQNKDSYFCESQLSLTSSQQGQLNLMTTYQGQAGEMVSYSLPFSRGALKTKLKKSK